MPVRRLLVLVSLSLATTLAACGSLPTAADETDTPPPATTDTTKRGEVQPWH